VRRPLFKTFLLLLILIAFATVIFVSYNLKKESESKSLLENLKGEIVYVKRDEKTLNVYKISANGSNKKLLYHNTDNNDAKNNHCDYPRWSEDGSTIYFTAMKNGEWKTFSIDSESNNASVIEKDPRTYDTYNKPSRSSDIYVDEGSIYLEENGKRIKVYSNFYYDYKFHPGAYGAVWSPDKKFIVFSADGNIKIADKQGKVVTLTEGTSPDWKY